MKPAVRTAARGTTLAPNTGPLGPDAFEAAVDDAICRPSDLFDLDGDTLLRYRNGCVETLDSDTPRNNID
jgi:hypothetical protein